MNVDVVGSGPLVQALDATRAVQARPVISAAVAIKRVKDGQDEGALVAGPRRATLYFSNTYANQAAELQGIVRGVADQVNLRATGRPPLVRVSPRAIDSSSLRYIDFLVPGLIAMALCQSAIFGIASSLVSWRERGMFRRLRVTPLPLAEFGAGRLLSSLALAFAPPRVWGADYGDAPHAWSCPPRVCADVPAAARAYVELTLHAARKEE